MTGRLSTNSCASPATKLVPSARRVAKRSRAMTRGASAHGDGERADALDGRRPHRSRATRDRGVHHRKIVCTSVEHDAIATDDVQGRRRVQPAGRSTLERMGREHTNTRYQDAAMARLSAADVPRLRVKWAFAFPGELSVDSQPTVAGGRVFAGTQSGAVYALDAASGCVRWMFQAAAAVRAAVSVGRIDTRSGQLLAAFIGDRAGNVYAVDASPGELLWKQADRSLPVRAGDRLADLPQRAAVCRRRVRRRDRGGDRRLSVLQVPRQSRRARCRGRDRQVWKTYTIAEEPMPTTKNSAGTQLWGPSGAPIWSSPAIDTERNAVYVTTGNNYTGPPTRNERRLRGVRSASRGKMLWSTPDDGGRRLEHVVPSARADQLHERARRPTSISRRRRSWFAAERPPRARRGSEVRCGPRPRSGSRRRD